MGRQEPPLIRWRLKQDYSISGAAQDDTVEWLLFKDLAERLADGRISEEDLVLEHGTSEWIPADSIVGLVRAAGRIRRELKSHHVAASIHVTANDDVAVTTEVLRPSTGFEHKGSVSERDSHQSSTTFGLLNQQVSPQRLLPVIAVFAIIGLLTWQHWSNSDRFPVPAHMAKLPVRHSMPLIGGISTVELVVICLDFMLVSIGVVFWIRKWKSRK